LGSMAGGSRFSLAGRRALVTGASRGNGRALALGLAEAGADLAVAGRTMEDLKATAAAVAATDRPAGPLTLCVADVAAIRQVVAEAAAALGGLDLLVNNAGIEEVRPALAVDEALWDRILDTNLKGAFFCAQAAARAMVEAGRGGVIVNLCSLTSEA